MGGTGEAPNSHPVIRPDHRAVGWWSIASWAVLGAIASIFVSNLLLDLVHSDWAMAPRHWLLQFGFSRTAIVYVLALMQIPDVICASVGGAVIGLTVRRRWFCCALSFATAYIFAQPVLLAISGMFAYSVLSGPALSVSISIAAVVLPTYGFVWLGRRWGRRERWMLADSVHPAATT